MVQRMNDRVLLDGRVLVVKGLMLNRNISLFDKILAIMSDQFEYLYCRKHRLYYTRPEGFELSFWVLWYGIVLCPKCFEERFGNEDCGGCTRLE
jgi:hypothetical protein